MYQLLVTCSHSRNIIQLVTGVVTGTGVGIATRDDVLVGAVTGVSANVENLVTVGTGLGTIVQTGSSGV